MVFDESHESNKAYDTNERERERERERVKEKHEISNRTRNNCFRRKYSIVCAYVESAVRVRPLCAYCPRKFIILYGNIARAARVARVPVVRHDRARRINVDDTQYAWACTDQQFNSLISNIVANMYLVILIGRCFMKCTSIN